MTTTTEKVTPLRLEDWGTLDYTEAFSRQDKMVLDLQQQRIIDTLVLVQHPQVVTLGRRGSEADLRCPAESFTASGVALQHINRGGLATAHEPGQLVAYPIVQLKRKDLRWFANTFLQVVVSVLADFGVEGYLKEGEPGVWVHNRKICSFGIAVKKWISSHGIALNVNNNLETFKMIIPCGRAEENVTSLACELGHELNMAEVKERFVQHFLHVFAYQLKD